MKIRFRGRARAALSGAAVAVLGVSALVATAPAADAAISVSTSTYYVLVNVNSGKALDLYNWSTADGAEFRQWTRTDADNQQFQLVSSGDGYYRLKNKFSGKVADVWNWSTADGGEVNQYTDLGGANQQWKLTGSDNNSVRFINRNSGKAMEVYNWSTEDGGDIAQWTDYGNANQQWKLVAVGSGASSGGSTTTTTTSSSSSGGSTSTPSGAFGYATVSGSVTGGGSGPTVTVTSLSALTSAVASSTAQTVKISGMITATTDIKVASNKTILGVGSNSGITGGGLNLTGVSNVIIRNLKLSKFPAANGTGDLIHIDKGTTHVWIDHNELSNDTSHDKDYYDGLIDITHAGDYITISWNYLHDHWKGSLVGHSDSNASEDTGHLHVTYAYNYFKNINSRLPSLRFGTGHVYNNYFDTADTAVHSRMGAQMLVQNNVFKNVGTPIETTNDSDVDGYVNQSGNDFGGGTNEITRTGSFTTAPYSVSLLSTSSVVSSVTAGVGTGKVG